MQQVPLDLSTPPKYQIMQVSSHPQKGLRSAQIASIRKRFFNHGLLQKISAFFKQETSLAESTPIVNIFRFPLQVFSLILCILPPKSDPKL